MTGHGFELVHAIDPPELARVLKMQGIARIEITGEMHMFVSWIAGLVDLNPPAHFKVDDEISRGGIRAGPQGKDNILAAPSQRFDPVAGQGAGDCSNGRSDGILPIPPGMGDLCPYQRRVGRQSRLGGFTACEFTDNGFHFREFGHSL